MEFFGNRKANLPADLLVEIHSKGTTKNYCARLHGYLSNTTAIACKICTKSNML